MTSAQSKNLFVHDFGEHITRIFIMHNALDIYMCDGNAEVMKIYVYITFFSVLCESIH
jgi:hypothetical protein